MMKHYALRILVKIFFENGHIGNIRSDEVQFYGTLRLAEKWMNGSFYYIKPMVRPYRIFFKS